MGRQVAAAGRLRGGRVRDEGVGPAARRDSVVAGGRVPDTVHSVSHITQGIHKDMLKGKGSSANVL